MPRKRYSQASASGRDRETRMSGRDGRTVSRRRFLRTLVLTAAAGTSARSAYGAAELPPETRTLKLGTLARGVCAPMDVLAEDLYKSEGFTDVRWLDPGLLQGRRKALAAGAIDFNIQFCGSYITAVDAGDPVVLLAGLHVGCYELFAADRIRTMRDLKGKSVAVTELGTGRHLLLASALKYIGLDPAKDVSLVTSPAAESMRLFGEGKIDAFVGFAPEPQELRTRKIGHVVLNTTVERPWSQYFCCMLTANRTFVQKHPVATKRVLRAILKATDMCALEPARVAQFAMSKGATDSYEYALQALKELPYDKWRTLHPEDTVRFYALRLREAGIITSSPQKIIAQGTDWRFLNELRKELKA